LNVAEDESKVPGIGLDVAIEALRADLIAAMQTGAGKAIQFPVEKMTVELDVVATKSLDGKAGFKVPIVEVELGGGGGWKHENTQKVTVEFGSPVDQDGIPIKVARHSGEKP
jgi:Trypsin-co-occurring domain 2